MADRRPLVNVTGRTKEMPSGDTVPDAVIPDTIMRVGDGGIGAPEDLPDWPYNSVDTTTDVANGYYRKLTGAIGPGTPDANKNWLILYFQTADSAAQRYQYATPLKASDETAGHWFRHYSVAVHGGWGAWRRVLDQYASNQVTNDLLRDSAALSVIGRSANSSGDPADIAAGTDHQVLRRSGTSIGFGAIDLSQSAAVTNALPVANGGSGAATLTGYLKGNGTSAFTGHTISDILTDLLTVDGAGSGLDADTVDGLHVGTTGSAVANLAGANEWSARQDFNASIKVVGSLPFVWMHENDQAADAGGWFSRVNGGNYELVTATDAGGGVSTRMSMTRTGGVSFAGGVSTTTLSATGTSTLSGTVQLGGATTHVMTQYGSSYLVLNSTDAGHAKGGYFAWDSDPNTRIGGMGALANSGVLTNIYVGRGSSPWTGERGVVFQASATVFNDTGLDHDLRIEGDTDANLLFCDASTDRVGIGTASPGTKLEVSGNTAIARIRSSSARGAGNCYMDFYDPTGRKGYIGYASGASDDFYVNNDLTATTHIRTGGADRITCDASGAAVTGALTASTTITAAKSLLVDDVFQLTAVSSAGQTRTVDLANGAVQTLSANQDFTIAASGPAGKSGHVRLYIYNPSGALINITAGSGWFSAVSYPNSVTANKTRWYDLHWDGQQMTTGSSVDDTGDKRPT